MYIRNLLLISIPILLFLAALFERSQEIFSYNSNYYLGWSYHLILFALNTFFFVLIVRKILCWFKGKNKKDDIVVLILTMLLFLFNIGIYFIVFILGLGNFSPSFTF